MPLGGLLPYGPQQGGGMMQQPMQQDGQQQAGQNGQKPRGGGKFDPMQTVLQQPLQLLGQIISKQMMEASQMGVPYTSILDQLMQTAQTAGQGAGMALAGGSNQPPGGPMGPGGGPPQPPGGPQPGMMQDQTQQGAYQQLTPGQVQNSPYQQGMPGFGNPQPGMMQQPGAINAALTGQAPQAPQQGGGGGNFLYQPGNAAMGQGPSMLGGFITQTPADQVNYANAAQTRQAIAGQTPLQAKDKQELAIAEAKAGQDYHKQILEQEKADTTDFNKATENYRITLPRFATIREMVQNPQAQQNNGFGDLMLINEVLKNVDPTTANREGEVKTWSEAESRFKRAGLAVSGGWYTGRKLTDSGRKQIYRLMTTKFNEVTKDAGRYHQAYSKKIKGYGGDPERALTRVSLDDGATPAGGVRIKSIKEIK